MSDAATRRLAGFAGLVVLAMHLALFGPRAWVDAFAGREQIAEHLGAFAFLLASIFFARAGIAARSGVASSKLRPVAFALLALFFFVACGEELSWGQHALGYGTPEPLLDLNAQQEVNFHNLWWFDSYAADGEKKTGLAALLLNSNRLFDLFMVGFFWLLPLAARRPATRGWIERLGLPVAATLFGWLVLGLWAATALLELAWVDGQRLHLAVSEVREASYGVVSAAVALWMDRRERSPGSAEATRVR